MTKALILARGLGTRMQRDEAGAQLTDEQKQLAGQGAKGLLPIAGRPFLDYLVAELLDAGMKQIALVIGPEHDLLREYIESANRRIGESGRLAFVIQEQPLGTANAVLAGKHFAGADDTIVLNSDNLYSTETLKLLVAAPVGASYVAGYDRDALMGRSNIEAERVQRLAVVQADGDGDMIRIVEKPEEPEAFATQGRVLLSLNCFRFSPRIYEACAEVPKSSRGEYELPDAVALMQRRGEPVKVLYTTGLFIDMTSRADIAEVERLLGGRKLSF